LKRLEGKVALISGRARGPGRAAALRFAAEGAIVVDGDLRHESEPKAQRLVARAGGAALTPGPLDATDEDSARACVEEAADAFGGIDILYANADAVAVRRRRAGLGMAGRAGRPAPPGAQSHLHRHRGVPSGPDRLAHQPADCLPPWRPRAR
jgi:NAD(P)-dependent dehydrogenase (short-subunit alcohol dehydrogenase family)